jgi:hypothetical protein
LTSPGAEVADLAVVVDVHEELLSGQLLAAADDARDAPVGEPHLVHDAALAAEAEADAVRPARSRAAYAAS